MNRSKPHKARPELTPVRTSRILFDATQPRRPQPYFGQGCHSRFIPYYRAPASIEDMNWAIREFNRPRAAEPVWDSETIDEVLSDETVMLDRYATMSL